MDHQIRVEILHGLRQRGIDVLTAYEDGRDRHADQDILARAGELNRVLVTQDQDFHHVCRRWQDGGREFPGMVFVHQKSLDIGRTLEYLELISHLLAPEEMRNRVEYVPAR